MASVVALAARRSLKFYLYTAAGLFAFLLLWLWYGPGPTLKAELVTKFISYSGGWQVHAASTNDPDAEAPLNVDPLKVEPLDGPESQYSKDKWFFEFDLPDETFAYPSWNVSELAQLAPHNYRGPGHEAFATFYLSRNASLTDPYFLATQQVVYRLLWEPNTKSKRHPVIVFVPPFVTKRQREIFAAAGAIVREVDQLTFAPNHKIVGFVAGRLKDVFTKLEMWNQTDFTKIAYLDSDAFPIVNIDSIFELVEEQKCKPDLIAETNQDLRHTACDYGFTALKEWTGMLNAGVMILQPNQGMHELLIREYHANTNFDNGFVEQALLTYVFREDGPFPATTMNSTWNGSADVKDRGDPLYILHTKLWATFAAPDHWTLTMFQDTWDAMGQLYGSEAFASMRAADEARASV